MYIVGHLVLTEKSRRFARETLYGDGALALMLPDYVRCHEWGYERCFKTTNFTLKGLLIQAHMLGDWYVHYGQASETPAKTGWAYQRMRPYACRYDRFYSEAARLGLRENVRPTDSVRGFGHTMMEYSIDTFLIRRGDFDNRFDTIRSTLGRLGLDDGVGSQRWLSETLSRDGISAEPAALSHDVMTYRQRVLACKNAEEFAFRAGVYKFGLKPGNESVAFVKSFIDEGMQEIPEAEISETVEGAAAFVRTWLGKANMTGGDQLWT
jgi:hypothetical protein